MGPFLPTVGPGGKFAGFPSLVTLAVDNYIGGLPLPDTTRRKGSGKAKHVDAKRVLFQQG